MANLLYILHSTIYGEKGDAAGTGVAVSAGGKYVAIGYPGRDLDYTNDGIVKVFRRNGNDYQQVGDSITGVRVDLLGSSVALSGDGQTLAVGAPFTTNYGKKKDGSNDISFNVGSVRVYGLTDDVWTLRPPVLIGKLGGEHSGEVVALSEDGKVLLITAPGSDNSARSAGELNVYTYDDNTWTKLGKTLLGARAWDKMGLAADFSADGKVLAVATILNDSIGNDAGRVDVYQFTAGAWTAVGAPLFASHRMDKFGTALSLSDNGKTLAIGARCDNNQYKGYVEVYALKKTNWSIVGHRIEGNLRGEEFGTTLALSGNGKVLAVCSAKKDPARLQLYTIGKEGLQPLPEKYLGVFPYSMPNGGIALSKKGKTIVVGLQSSDKKGKSAGEVRIYTQK